MAMRDTEFIRRIESVFVNAGVENISQLCAKSGINKKTFSRLEDAPFLHSTKDMVALAKTLNVSIDWLVGIHDDQPEELTPEKRACINEIKKLPDEEILFIYKVLVGYNKHICDMSK